MTFPRPNKFKVVPKEQRSHAGVVYASRLEARYAAHLDTLTLEGQIAGWSRGERIPLTVGVFVVAHYKPDFIVHTRERQWLVEVKNFWVDKDILRVRLFGACHPELELRCVMRKGRAWVESQPPRPKPIAPAKRSRRSAVPGRQMVIPA